MDREKLEKDLEELKKEIGGLEKNHRQKAERLQELADSIEKTLNSSTGTEDDGDLIDNVQNNIKHLEAEHPDVTKILNRIATLFSDMGI